MFSYVEGFQKRLFIPQANRKTSIHVNLQQSILKQMLIILLRYYTESEFSNMFYIAWGQRNTNSMTYCHKHRLFVLFLNLLQNRLHKLTRLRAFNSCRRTDIYTKIINRKNKKSNRSLDYHLKTLSRHADKASKGNTIITSNSCATLEVQTIAKMLTEVVLTRQLNALCL